MTKRKLDENNVPVAKEAAEVTATNKEGATAFEDLQLDPRLLQAIAKSQFTTPTAVQAQTIPLALKGRDILVKSQTGSGKTAAYVLPCIHSILVRKAQSAKNASPSILVLVPTRELSDQVTRAFRSFAEYCGKDVKALNLTQKVSEPVLTSRLNEAPDVLVSTPGKVAQLLTASVLRLESIQKLVVDEADVVLSYGYEDDLQAIAKALSNGVQSFLISATLTTEVDQLKDQFCHDPILVHIQDQEEKAENVTQYVVKCSEDDKFLLLFVIFKLRLVKGKTIIFVQDLNRSYRLKLYLEQFGIKSCILNSELPVNSRLHTVQEFNKGMYDILIAADDQEVIGGIKRKSNHADDDESASEDAADEEQPQKKKTEAQKDFGVSRGIDFQNVSCVLNFDLPSSTKSYTHRIGRTARAGSSGMALSFVIPKEQFGKNKHTSVPSTRHDEKMLEKIKTRQARKGKEIKDYQFDMTQVEGFRYRMNDALRTVTPNSIREARTREIRQELLKSEKLQKHFEDNPEDLKALRQHGSSSAGILRVQGHMKHVPDYLLPGKKRKLDATAGFVSLNSEKKRAKNDHRGRSGKSRKHPGRKTDPLKSFRAKRK